MQTFLPYSSFEKSAKCLDWRRLGKQRVEAFQILKALVDPSYGWQQHPAVNMWRNCELALNEYYQAIVTEWICRGYRNTMPRSLAAPTSFSVIRYPLWLGNPRFHSSHRAALLYKDPTWYGKFDWKETAVVDYYWPTSGHGESVSMWSARWSARLFSFPERTAPKRMVKV